jgi:hypothetical protein
MNDTEQVEELIGEGTVAVFRSRISSALRIIVSAQVATRSESLAAAVAAHGRIADSNLLTAPRHGMLRVHKNSIIHNNSVSKFGLRAGNENGRETAE